MYSLNYLTFKPNILYLAAHSAVVLKAESTADKVEWLNKISKVIQARGGLVRVAESGHTMRQSLSDGSLVSKLYCFLCSFTLFFLCGLSVVLWFYISLPLGNWLIIKF